MVHVIHEPGQGLVHLHLVPDRAGSYPNSANHQPHYTQNDGGFDEVEATML